jgi:hypothetical protein
MNSHDAELLYHLGSLSLREMDILVGTYFYKLDVKFERVAAKNSNNIRYYYIQPQKRKYFNHTLKKNQKPLPRYSTDIRDCFSLLKDANAKYGNIVINYIDKDNSEVIISGFKVVGKLQPSIVKSVLFQTLKNYE